MPDLADTRSTKTGLGLLTGLAAATVAGGNDVLVDVGGTQVTAHTLRSASVTSGDPLLIGRQGSQYWVIGPTNTAPPPPPVTPPEATAPPSPKPVTRTGKLIVSPVETRSYREGRWRTDTDDTFQGEYGGSGEYTGAAFYGKKPASLAGATCTSAYVRLRRVSGGAYAFGWINLWTAEQKTRPSGAITRVDSTDGPGLKPGQTSSAWRLPTSWGQDFIDGTIGSLACYGGDYLRLSGRSSWSAAWTLAIYWRKTS